MGKAWRKEVRQALKRGPRRVLSPHLKRLRMHLWQRYRFDRSQPSQPVFIVGCQRSGTKMLLNTLDRSPETWSHDHRLVDPIYFFRHDPAYAKTPDGGLSRLREPALLRRLIERCPAPVVVFHAIAEAQQADTLLERYPGAKVVWIYRNYADVANSAVRKWGDHQKDVIRRFRDQEWDRLKWRGERVSRETTERLAQSYSDDLSSQEGAVLFWYLRNHWYFTLRLDTHDRVMLVKYEDLVAEPLVHFARLFAFVGLPFAPSYVSAVHAASVGKDAPPVLREGIRALCDALLAALDARCGQGHLRPV